MEACWPQPKHRSKLWPPVNFKRREDHWRRGEGEEGRAAIFWSSALVFLSLAFFLFHLFSSLSFTPVPPPASSFSLSFLPLQKTSPASSHSSSETLPPLTDAAMVLQILFWRWVIIGCACVCVCVCVFLKQATVRWALYTIRRPIYGLMGPIHNAGTGDCNDFIKARCSVSAPGWCIDWARPIWIFGVDADNDVRE